MLNKGSLEVIDIRRVLERLVLFHEFNWKVINLVA